MAMRMCAVRAGGTVLIGPPPTRMVEHPPGIRALVH